MSAPSKNLVLALESFHCSWAKRKEQGRASPEVGTWKGFSQVHQELVGRTANGHLVSWVLGLNFTCWRAFPGQFFFIYPTEQCQLSFEEPLGCRFCSPCFVKRPQQHACLAAGLVHLRFRLGIGPSAGSQGEREVPGRTCSLCLLVNWPLFTGSFLRLP